MAEWPIAAVLKTAVGQPTVGSNPTSSVVLLEGSSLQEISHGSHSVLEHVFKLTFRRVFGLFWPIWVAKRRGNITLRILPLRFASQISSKEPKNRPKFILKTRS